MSIAVLTQVYDEMRRLAIAGSTVASGDFRLKKLIPPLEQAGAKSPVFAKAADAVKAVVDGPQANSATALLDLTTLVNAVLYTQGETGASGELQPIETTDLGVPTTQASARVLKPLLEALTTTGSGRLELIKDAFERGAFRDLRLVKPALEAIDDGYTEVADLVAGKILPIYGAAILPELRAKFDLKGKGGHAKRLRLMHELDPAGTRELVKQALDEGSKDVKVVAIACLGAGPEDLSYLIEQSSAKAQEVRQAAYIALSSIGHNDAFEVLKKVMKGKDLDLASGALRLSRSPAILSSLIADAEAELASLPKAKDKKEAGSRINRIQSLLYCLSGREDKDSEAFLLKVFKDRDAIHKIKGEPASGEDLNARVVEILREGTPRLCTALADAHGALPAGELATAFSAARQVYPAPKVFDMFSPYLTAKVDEKKKRDEAFLRREAIIEAMGGRYRYWASREDSEAPLDPRWLDLAVGMKNLTLVWHLGRPGNAKANAFLKETFDTTIKKSKSLDECHEVVAAMVAVAHPDATDAFLAALGKHQAKLDYHAYWFSRLIPNLPKSALPKLEAMLPTLKERVADEMIGYIQELREKKE